MSGAIEPEWVGSINPDCACCICFQPPPVGCIRVVLPCQHLFCAACFDEATKGGKSWCPVDRTPIDNVNCRVELPSDDVAALVGNVPVQCPFQRAGCRWEGSWHEWQTSRHGLLCAFKPERPCTVPKCTSTECNESARAAAEAVTPHEQEALYRHVRLLCNEVIALKQENQELRLSVDQLKERLYGVQNDLTHWQHHTAEDQERRTSHFTRLERDALISREDVLCMFPSFKIHCMPPPALPPPAIVWDERCSNRNSVVDGQTLRHSAASKGWATAFSRHPIVVTARQPPVTVRYSLSPPVSAQGASSVMEFSDSMVMVGLSTHRHSSGALQHCVSHAGSLQGCWVLQASGFMWDGETKLCGILSEDAKFGIGDCISMTLEVVEKEVGQFECVVKCSKNDATDFGTAATVSVPSGRNGIAFHTVASIGCNCVCVEVTTR